MTLAIYGAGGFGRELIPLARSLGSVVFVSDRPSDIGTSIHGVAIHAFDDLYRFDDLQIVIAVADVGVRRRLAIKCDAAGLKVGSLTAHNHDRGLGVSVEEGAIFSGPSTCSADTVVGRHFHCNVYSYVAHDCSIGDFVTLAPYVCVSGNTIIGDDVYIGAGALLKHGTQEKPLRVGKGAIIGMGAVVTKDVEAGLTVVGSPARPLIR